MVVQKLVVDLVIDKVMMVQTQLHLDLLPKVAVVEEVKVDNQMVDLVDQVVVQDIQVVLLVVHLQLNHLNPILYQLELWFII